MITGKILKVTLSCDTTLFKFTLLLLISFHSSQFPCTSYLSRFFVRLLPYCCCLIRSFHSYSDDDFEKDSPVQKSNNNNNNNNNNKNNNNSNDDFEVTSTLSLSVHNHYHVLPLSDPLFNRPASTGGIGGIRNG